MKITRQLLAVALLPAALVLLSAAPPAIATPNGQPDLFESIGAREFVNLPEHVSSARLIRVNPRALTSSRFSVELEGVRHIAVRTRVEQRRGGELVWVGHLQGDTANTVHITRRGDSVGGFIKRGSESFEILLGAGGHPRLVTIDLRSLPTDDPPDTPKAPPEADTQSGSTLLGMGDALAGDNVQQDLLIVYNQGACNWAGSCAQMETRIVSAVAMINTAYGASGINVTMNLVGMAWVDYTGTDHSAMLSDLRGTTDGKMDEVHALRDKLGADIVAMVAPVSSVCGVGYLTASASSAFSVTAPSCLAGHTLTHEIGHNQGAHHDRLTVGSTSTTAYNFGFRRCSDTSADNIGSPYFRTIMAYSCSGAGRVGHMSNPDVSYSGVPTGVDPNIDPARGAHNSRRLNERAVTVAGFRPSAVATAPAAPSNLAAAAASFSAIQVTWADNAFDEQSFVLQSAPDGTNWTTIATLPANTTSYTHDGLAPQVTRYYRVRADNGLSSAYSNVAFATTPPAPAVIDDLATADVRATGSVSGDYTLTHALDGRAQVITEVAIGGGNPRNRQAGYEHAWTFNVYGGPGGVVATVDAWVSGSEGANFFYSTDGGSTQVPMFTVDNTNPGVSRSFDFPPNLSGALRISVRDAARSAGEAADSVHVDRLVVSSLMSAGTPPQAPSALAVTATSASSVSLSFQDNAEDERGFEVRRATGSALSSCDDGVAVASLPASAGTGSVSFTDEGVSPSTTYSYRVRAFNGAGSGCSDSVTATTGAAPAIALTVTAYKVKGLQAADLRWSGISGVGVDVRRDGQVIAGSLPVGTTTYTDSLGVKGSGTYRYQVCEAGSTSACSPEQVATF